MDPTSFDVLRVPVDEILPLRTRVLRPGFIDRLAEFDGDRLPTTHHYAVIGDAGVVACATFMVAECPAHPTTPALQLRGMAVEPTMQNKGLGRRLMDNAMVELPLLMNGHPIVWCNSREHAEPFYARLGFETWGPHFEVPGIGPHVVMWRRLPLILA